MCSVSMPSVIMCNVIMSRVIVLNDIMHGVLTLSDIVSNVIKLSVIKMSGMAPAHQMKLANSNNTNEYTEPNSF